MSFQKFKSDSNCVGGRHSSDTKHIFGDISSNGSKVLIGYSSICKRKTSMGVSDDTIQAEGLSDFFKNLRKGRPNVSNRMAKKTI